MLFNTAQKCAKRFRPAQVRIHLPMFNPIITKFYADIHADLFYSRTGYGVTNYFYLEVRNRKPTIRLGWAKSHVC